MLDRFRGLLHDQEHKGSDANLLAEDSPAVLAGVRRLLEPEFEVVGSVEDGSSLLSAAKELRPDALIGDIMMPGLSGMEPVFGD
jgi:CheY-like chemotaxis protein